ncbi:hypothetical protein JL722_12473 [Aureococcus anophagefferens]|nr:hypothetical protein JL722_12473 [Aureococcus anophagefferens]
MLSSKAGLRERVRFAAVHNADTAPARALVWDAPRPPKFDAKLEWAAAGGPRRRRAPGAGPKSPPTILARGPVALRLDGAPRREAQRIPGAAPAPSRAGASGEEVLETVVGGRLAVDAEPGRAAPGAPNARDWDDDDDDDASLGGGTGRGAWNRTRAVNLWAFLCRAIRWGDVECTKAIARQIQAESGATRRGASSVRRRPSATAGRRPRRAAGSAGAENQHYSALHWLGNCDDSNFDREARQAPKRAEIERLALRHARGGGACASTSRPSRGAWRSGWSARLQSLEAEAATRRGGARRADAALFDGWTSSEDETEKKGGKKNEEEGQEGQEGEAGVAEAGGASAAAAPARRRSSSTSPATTTATWRPRPPDDDDTVEPAEAPPPAALTEARGGAAPARVAYAADPGKVLSSADADELGACRDLTRGCEGSARDRQAAKRILRKKRAEAVPSPPGRRLASPPKARAAAGRVARPRGDAAARGAGVDPRRRGAAGAAPAGQGRARPAAMSPPPAPRRPGARGAPPPAMAAALGDSASVLWSWGGGAASAVAASARAASAAADGARLYGVLGDTYGIVAKTLHPGETFHSEPGAMVFMSNDVRMSAKFGRGFRGAVSQAVSGEALAKVEYTNAGAGPGYVGMTANQPFSTVIPCSSRRCPAARSTSSAGPTWRGTPGATASMKFQRAAACCCGGLPPVIQSVSGAPHGTAFLSAAGTIVAKSLQPARPSSSTRRPSPAERRPVRREAGRRLLHLLPRGEGCYNTVLTGPGNVYLQSISIDKLMAQLVTVQSSDGGGGGDGAPATTGVAVR